MWVKNIKRDKYKWVKSSQNKGVILAKSFKIIHFQNFWFKKR